MLNLGIFPKKFGFLKFGILKILYFFEKIGIFFIWHFQVLVFSGSVPSSMANIDIQQILIELQKIIPLQVKLVGK